jgi:hypothetical protein
VGVDRVGPAASEQACEANNQSRPEAWPHIERGDRPALGFEIACQGAASFQ